MRSEINSYRFKIITLQHQIHDFVEIDGYLLLNIISKMNLNFRDSFEAYTHDKVDSEIEEFHIPYMNHGWGLY